MNVRVSENGFDPSFVDVYITENEYSAEEPTQKKQTHSEILACGCDLLKRPKTISSDLGIEESAPEERRFSAPGPSSHFPKSRKDRHKYIFGRTCAELGSAPVDCRGSPGQNIRELSG
jgi:hypothetical protein